MKVKRLSDDKIFEGELIERTMNTSGYGNSSEDKVVSSLYISDLNRTFEPLDEGTLWGHPENSAEVFQKENGL